MKLFLPVLFLAFAATSLNAQNYLKKYVPGVIAKGTDSTQVNLKVNSDLSTGNINLYKMQFAIKTIDKAGKKMKVLPAEYDYVKFDYKGETFQLESKSGVQGIIPGTKFTQEDRLFLRVVVDGIAQIIAYTEQEVPSMGTVYSKTALNSFLIQVDNGKIYKPTRGGKLNEPLSRLFKDCPKALDYLENDEVYYNELFKVIEMYNAECTNVK